MPWVFVQATLPHSDPGPVPRYRRENGRDALTIATTAEEGLPYGRYPRLLLMWLTTAGIRTKQQELPLPATSTAFLNQLGIAPTYGPRGTVPAFAGQARRLLGTMITWERREPDNGGTVARYKNIPIADAWTLWWDDGEEDEPSRFEIVLSEQFLSNVCSRPVPARSWDVVRGLRSPLELDIYMWLPWRLKDLEKPSRVIGWDGLELQFGAGYNRPRDFKATFCSKLEKVLKLLPEARVHVTRSGLILKPSPQLFED